MPLHADLSTYDDVKADTGPSHITEDFQQRPSGSAAPEKPDATVVLLRHFDRTKPKDKKVIVTVREAIVLQQGITFTDSFETIKRKTANRAKWLRLSDEDLYYTLLFDSGKRPSELVDVSDEESWAACLILLRKTERSQLRFYVMPESTLEHETTEGGRGSGERDRGARRPGRKCTVQ